MSNGFLASMIDTLAAWLDHTLGPPTIADARKRRLDWEYDQADLQPWHNEPDPQRLSAALRLSRYDPEAAFTELHRLAEDGSPRALNALGERYWWGRVVQRDRPEGERWFKRAFEFGSRRGLLNYGKALYWQKDLDGAEAVFRVGADEEWGPALYWLSLIKLRRPLRKGALTAARQLLERAVKTGSPGAKTFLGVLMATGIYGLRNMRVGRKLLEEDLEEALQAEAPADGEAIH